MKGKRRFNLSTSPTARWSTSLFILILLGSVLLTSPHAARAQMGDVSVMVDDVDVSALPTVRIHVSVRDQTGVPIPDLTPAHFEIVEDGAAAFVPTTAEAVTNPDAQVSLAVVIDLFRTLKGAPMEAAQEATRVLLTDLLDDPDASNRAAFVGVRQGLSTDPLDLDETYEVPFTNDRNRLLNVVSFLHERIQETGPGTPLFDAVIKAVRMAEATEPVTQRAVIVMTDGEDRGSTSTDSDTIQRAVNARTPVFTVGLSNAGLDEQYLTRLAENTGAVYQAAETAEDFSPLFSNVLTMLRQQYVLTYDSGLPQDGQPHSLMVRVRTPTQTEGFQEYRVAMPAVAVGGDDEPAVPGADEPVSEPESEIQPTLENDGLDDQSSWFATTTDWVQDNLLLAGLAIGAVALFFLALLIVVIIVVRRRRGGADAQAGIPPLEPPPYPSEPGWTGDPEADFGRMPARGATGVDDVGLETEGPGVPPPATVTDDEWSFGMRPASPYEGRPPDPPGFPQPGHQPSSADRTRILQQRPKMSQVGLLIDRDRPEQRLDVTLPVVTIGRSEQSDVTIDHNTVSRQHAVIKLEEQQFRLYDMGSTNGTFVGDTRVREPVDLEDGMTVKFGEKVFIFKIISLET